MYFVEDNDLGMDREAFEQIWENILRPEIGTYQKDFSQDDSVLSSLELQLALIPNVKEMIWDRYCFFNLRCKSEYMDPPRNGKSFLLDRHKVAACYIAAIVSVQPMHLYSVQTKEPANYPINELLALTTGLSIMRAFLMIEEIPANERRNAENGIMYPPHRMISHGDYINNFANELHFAFLDGNINLLTISHELFLLEVITRLGVGDYQG